MSNGAGPETTARGEKVGQGVRTGGSYIRVLVDGPLPITSSQDDEEDDGVEWFEVCYLATTGSHGIGYVCQDDFRSVKLSSDHTHSGARSPERAIDRIYVVINTGEVQPEVSSDSRTGIKR